MPLPYWQADASRYPLITVHLVGVDGNQQPDIESLPRIVEDLIKKGAQVVVVYDLTGSQSDAQRRQFLVSWLRKNRQELARCVVASAIVAPTPLHRGILVATFWFIKPLRCPMQSLRRLRGATHERPNRGGKPHAQASNGEPSKRLSARQAFGTPNADSLGGSQRV